LEFKENGIKRWELKYEGADLSNDLVLTDEDNNVMLKFNQSNGPGIPAGIESTSAIISTNSFEAPLYYFNRADQTTAPGSQFATFDTLASSWFVGYDIGNIDYVIKNNAGNAIVRVKQDETI
jgi:hypothetical protein